MILRILLLMTCLVFSSCADTPKSEEERLYRAWASAVERGESRMRADPDKAIGEPSFYFRAEYRAMVAHGKQMLPFLVKRLSSFLDKRGDYNHYDVYLAYAIAEISGFREGLDVPINNKGNQAYAEAVFRAARR